MAVTFVAALWLVLSIFSAGAWAETSNVAFKVDQNFNHQVTRFPLEGMHVKVNCETCHKGGIFKGVPTACASCHNGSMAGGKSINHPNTSNACADCHNNVDFSQVHVDHSKIHNSCFTCHDGKAAEGKNKNHVKSSKTCEDCHLTITWTIPKFNHAMTDQPCQVCHDGLHTSGKPFNHIRSTNDCAQCHRVVAWKVGVFDHTGVVDGCFKCHDGIAATGKSGAHLKTSNDCQNCHTTMAWSPAHFDHKDPSVAAAGGCVDCHDGRRATGMAVPPHFAVTTNDCSVCHQSFTTWLGAKWDHQFARGLTSCYTCHNGQRPPAQGKIVGHIPDQTNDCAACHGQTNFVDWKGAFFDHTGSGPNCMACHDGRYAQFNAQAKDTKHLPTNNNCGDCHIGPSAPGGQFVLDKPFEHNDTNATCVTCHDGAKTLVSGKLIVGKQQGAKSPHLLTSDNCTDCHGTDVFAPAKRFDHSDPVVVAATCASCHDTGKPKAVARSPGHPAIPPGTDCSACHQNTSLWNTGAKPDHANFSGNCVSCHDGHTATGKNPSHFVTSNTCDACHDKNAPKFAPATFQHAEAINLSNCVSCHYSGQMFSTAPVDFKLATHVKSSDDCGVCHSPSKPWKPMPPSDFQHSDTVVKGLTCVTCHNGSIAIALPKPNTHLNTSNDCTACHPASPPLGGFKKPLATFIHADSVVAATACITCHNGVLAISTGVLKGKGNAKTDTKAPDHTPATFNTCGDCHTTLAFAPAHFNHALVTGQLCATCHDTGKPNAVVRPATHPTILPGMDCGSCHTTSVWTTNAKPDHSAASFDGQCFTCHNGTNAMGKTMTHYATSNACDSCHNKMLTAFKPATFDHTQATTVANCVTCHDGLHLTSAGKALGKSAAAPPHVNTSNTCASCHASYSSWVTTVLDHSDSVVSGTTCFACHNGTTAINTGKLTSKLANHVKSSNDCSVCHTTVVWKPVSLAQFSHADSVVAATACITCHNGSVTISSGVVKSKASAAADPKAPDHTKVSDACDNCHTTSAFTPAHIDHADPALAAQKCAACHDTGKPNAVARPATHPVFNAGTQDCKDCHVSTATWVTNAKPDHTQPGFAGKCVSCHNNNPTIGKSSTHIATTNACDSCHNTNLFKPVTVVDHTQVIGSCLSCHDGTKSISTGPVLGKLQGPSKAHIATTNTCDSCHTTVKFAPAKVVDHTQVTGTCLSCHDGAHKISAGPILGKLQGSTKSHLATTNACDSCHNTAKFAPTTVVDHTQVTGTCLSCHDGAHNIIAGPVLGKLQGPTKSHMATTNTCDACHTTVKFAPAKVVDHTQVTGTCLSCHDGTHTISTGNVIGELQGPSGKHLSTTTNCAACHNTVKFQPGLQPRQTDHTQTIGACFTCHDGTHTISTGPVVGKLQGPSGKHLTTANTCELCHTTTAFIPAHFDHTGVAAGTCFTCHNGVGATGKPATHMSTNNTCDGCHTTVVWKPVPAVQFKHVGFVIGTCYSCHNGALKILTGTVTMRSTAHIASTTACDTCHLSTTNWNVTAAQVDHTQVTGTCISCHVAGRKLSLTGGPISAKSTAHVKSSDVCSTCHAVGGQPWTVYHFDHTDSVVIATTCFTCHNGSIANANPKDAAHLNTNTNCQDCHVFTSWAVASPAKFNHVDAIGACASCHDGTHKLGITGTTVEFKSAAHFITTLDCALCHNTTLWNPMVPYIHQSAAYVAHYFGTTATTCITCHKQNNQKISYAQPGLFPNCAACHSTNFIPSHHPKYNTPATVFYNFTELKDCSGACHTYTDQTLSKIKNNQPGPHHKPSQSGWGG